MNQTQDQDERVMGRGKGEASVSSPSSSTIPLSPSGSDDPRVARALEEYLAALEMGTAPDREQFLADHGEIALLLAECLDGLEFIRGAAAQARQPVAMLSAVVAASEVQPEGPLGDFRIVREIGRGGMGVVYEAVQISLGRRVALKVLPFAAAMDPKQLQRFKNEAQAAAHLHHQHIVPVYGVGCERGVHYYAMQYIEGQTLAATIRELRQLAGLKTAEPVETAIPDRASAPAAATQPIAALATERSMKDPAYLRAVAQLGVQAAGALEYAHSQGIIHRDIKPANLLLDAQRNVWITDFGLAFCQGDAGLTLTGDVVGTLRYMSPEQARGKRFLVDQRTDIYSLGVTLYELLTLEPAFGSSDRQELLQQISSEEPQPPRRLNAAIPAELETIVLKAMAKGPEERYATAQELADDLQRYLKDEPIRARRPTFVQRLKKWTRRHLPVVWTAGLSFVAMLVLAVVGLAASNILIAREKAQTDAAKEELERMLYYQGIALAEREWSANNLSRVEQLLDACPADLRGWEWHYLKRLRYKTLSPLDHGSIVLCVAFNPTSQYLASGSRDGMIKVWDAHTGRLLRSMRADEKIIFGVAFRPDGQRLAAACSDGTVKIWDLSADKKALEWKAHSSRVSCLVFSPDGARLASSCFSYGWEGEPAGGEVKVWNAATGKEIFTFKGQPLGVHRLAFSSDGQYLASAGEDRTVKVWEATTGQERFTCLGHTAPVHAIAFSPDGRSLASASAYWGKLAHAEVKLWDARTGEERFTRGGHIGYILSVAFSPDGQRLASAGMDSTVKLWEVATGRETITLRGHRGVIQAVAFGHDGRQLASAGDTTVRVWDATPLDEKPGEEPLTFAVHPAGVLGVAFHPDGRRLASVADDGGVKLWDSQTGKALFTFSDSQGFWSIAFSPDGQRLAAGGRSDMNRRSEMSSGWSEVRVWDVRTGQKLHSLRGFRNIASGVAFSPDSRQLVSAHWDKTVRVWDTATGKEVRQISAHDWVISGLALSPDGKTIATASTDETVKVWDVATGRCICTLQPSHSTPPCCVAFRPDGKLLASAARADRTIKLWDTQTRQQQGDDLRDPTGGVQSLAFSPDGRLLAWGSTDATVKLWDARTKEIHSLRGHASWVEGVVFSPDGKRIASASLDGTVKLWQGPFVPEARGPVTGAPGLSSQGQK